MTEGKGEIVIYDRHGTSQIEVKLEGESLWLSQKLIAELFEKDINTISDHILNIYAEEELKEDSTTEVFPVVQQEGNRKVKRDVKFYNLDVILSVGYRVSSKRGTAFLYLYMTMFEIVRNSKALRHLASPATHHRDSLN